VNAVSVKRIAGIGWVVLPFTLGIMLLFQLSELPSSKWAVVLLPLLVVGWRVKIVRPLFWFVAGVLWASIQTEFRLAIDLPEEMEGVDLQLVGRVVDIPQHKSPNSIRFLFQIEKASQNLDDSNGKREFYFPAQVRLSWYLRERGDQAEPKAGERWTLKVRLKRPHGFMNPGGFSWEQWLFQKGVRATGYVVQNRVVQNRVVGKDTDTISSLRENTSEWMRTSSPSGGVLAALAVGDRQGVSTEEWDIFRQTGTSHLMAISGLHIGLVSALFFFLFRWLWSIYSPLLLHIPAQQIGAVGGIIGALGYAALAGFAIPTQRALVMVSVVMGMILFRRAVSLWSIYLTAMFILLVLDPFAVLSAGFWLSFGAVGLILYALPRRGSTERAAEVPVESRLSRVMSRVRSVVHIQLVLTLGMLPLLLLLFRQGSLVAPFTNIVAVPWISMVVVPLNLLAAMLHMLELAGAELLLTLAGSSFELLRPLLNWSAELSISHFRFHQPEFWTVLLATVGIVVAISPPSKNIRRTMRALSLLLLLPLILLASPRPAEGEAWVTVLDVGQGLAVVVETKERVMLYDTGDRFSRTFNAGSAVVTPFLEARDWDKIDMLIVSHGDRDHIGGLKSIQEEVAIVEAKSSVPKKVKGATGCIAGESWEWSGVKFKIIHPQTLNHFRGNNGSCVVRVESANGDSFLITGDIEHEAEQFMVDNLDSKILDVDALVVPHHGSRTSSTESWLDLTTPRLAIFPVGYRNRFSFPKDDIVERYRRRGVKLWMSDDSGAVEVKLGGGDPTAWRDLNQRVWFTQ